jgi:hypothetical protein
MYVAVVPNRSSPPAILLREGYREGGKVKSRTLANLSDWPQEKIEALRRVLRGDLWSVPVGTAGGAAAPFEIVRTRPHGHVAAVLGTLRRVAVDTVLASKRSPERDRVVAMIVARVLAPASQLALARELHAETLHSTLGECLGLESIEEDDLYEAMDWLLERQERIEQQLAKRHLSEGTLALYDVTSTYFEGRCRPLARFGHSRDGKRDKLQIVLGLLTNAEGCPVAVEVFEGNTADPKTLGSVLGKIRTRFGLQRLVLVGDRGMITSARIREELSAQAGIEWITALRAPAIAALVDGGSLQLGLFDDRDLAEINDPAYPGERLVVCRNRLLAEERSRKRQDLLQATELELDKVVAATRRARNPLRGKDRIGLRVGRVLGRFKMQKHFRISIEEQSLRYQRDQQRIDREAALDGIYVIRTNVSSEILSSQQTVGSYKQLSTVERAFRSLKTVDLKVRPIHHRLADRVRAHVLLCMLAYYVEWHMRDRLAPLLFDDDDPAEAQLARSSMVAPATRSTKALRKVHTKRTDADQPVHSFRTLLEDLSTIAKNRVRSSAAPDSLFDIITTPTALQNRAFSLLGVNHRM